MVEKARLDIEVSADKATKETRKLRSEFKKMGDESSKSSNEAKRSLKEVGDEAQNTKADMSALSVSVLGLGQSFAGVSDSIFGMQEKMIALKRSQFGLKQTETDLQRQQEDLNEAIREGTLEGRELERAMEDLKLAQEDYRIELEEVRGEQESLNSEFVSLGLNVGQTAAFMGIALSQMAAAANMTTVAFVKLKLAVLASAFSMKTLRAAMTLVSSHPLMTIALIVAAAGFAAWEANIFGVRDALSSLVGVELPAISTFLSDIFGGLMPEANAQLVEFEGNIGNVGEVTMETTDELSQMEKTLMRINGTTELVTGSMGRLDKVTSGLPAGFAAIKSDVDALNRSIEKTPSLLQRMQEGLNKIGGLEGLKKNDPEIIKKIEELSDFDKAIQGNKGLAMMRALFAEANEQAANGNLRGAIFLEKEAQRIGRSAASISGSPRLASFVGAIGSRNLGRTFGAETVSGGKLAQLFFRGPTVGKISKINAVERGVGGPAGSLRAAQSFGRSLTRSGLAGTGKRRSGRDRNPRGRLDKLSVQLERLFKSQARSNLRERQALEALTGLPSTVTTQFRRFGANVGLTSDQRRAILIKDALRQQSEQRRRQFEIFQGLKEEEGIGDPTVKVSPIQFLRLKSTPGGFKEVRGVIEFQKRTGQRVTGVTV